METRILVIEDHPDNLELMGYLLQSFGYTPILAGVGEEGCDAARREVPDLILCDIHLPDIDGHEIARRLKSDPAMRAIPLVAVTALAMVGDRSKVLASGFDGYLAKPIVPETFVKQVETFLRPDRRVSFGRPIPEEAPPAPAPAPPHKGVILVVDDSPTNIAVLSNLLESSGYDVIVAGKIKDGLKHANTNSLTLIISDVDLWDESGFEFLKLVKADPRLRGIPFVFHSVTIMWERDRSRGLALGADEFLVGPIDPPELLSAIEAVLSTHGTGIEDASPGATP
ncbi:MAG: response regulator [Planctomycetaceae bacterium]|nr:response regulator [Planctomycetaceae bacterium]